MPRKRNNDNDHVEYVKLFQTLHNQEMCPTVLRLVMYMYDVNQKILIIWNYLML